MTGFARAQGHDDDYSWIWELKSVNGRNLDLRCRVPPGFEALETTVRRVAPGHFRRGHVAVSLQVTRFGTAPPPQVNRVLLRQLLAALHDLDGDFAPPRLDGLLRLPGVLEPAVEDEDAARRRETRIAATLDAACASLAAAREEEGRRLAVVVEGLVEAIAGLVESASAAPGAQPEAMRSRLRAQLGELLDSGVPLPEERIAQEAALLATRADIREEIDRLGAHLAAVRSLLAQGGAVGRRLDFLCQELNREANTLCAKASDVALTGIGIELKAAIEQMREQIQNIE